MTNEMPTPTPTPILTRRPTELPTEASGPRGAADRQVKLLLAAIVVAAAVALLWPKGDHASIPGGVLLDSLGQSTTLGPQLADVSLVYFWATWCQTCMAELPSLQRLARDLRDQEGFRLLKVAVGDEPSQVENVLAGGSDQMLYDPEWQVARRFGTEAIPESYLVVQGKVTHKFVGPTDWDGVEARGRLMRALEGRRGA